MTSKENLKDRMDQLSALGILPWPKDDKINLKFSREFYNIFKKIWKDSLSKSKMKFNERLQVVSGVALLTIRPDLHENDIFELSKVCLFIWCMFYKVNEKEYHRYLKSKNRTGLDALL